MSERKAAAYAVALHDCETGFRLAINSERPFHAASTIKVAILLAVCKAIDEGTFVPTTRCMSGTGS